MIHKAENFNKWDLRFIETEDFNLNDIKYIKKWIKKNTIKYTEQKMQNTLETIWKNIWEKPDKKKKKNCWKKKELQKWLIWTRLEVWWIKKIIVLKNSEYKQIILPDKNCF